MALSAGNDDAPCRAHAAWPFGRGILATSTVFDGSLAGLVAVSAIPVLVAMWALLSPAAVLSQEMTWDLLFNLAGAWQLHFGHVPHVDFHEPVGQLTFMLTQAGFRLAGFTPHAVLAGAAVMAAALFLAAALASWRRLPLLPAAIFVVFVCLLVLMPANAGDRPNAYSFAMSYNRYGWSAITILFLILFLPPRPMPLGNLIDMAIAAALLGAMFYLKMTYFLVGVAALPVAAIACPHIGVRWKGWSVVAAGGIALALFPGNQPYWADLFTAADSGQLRDSLDDHLNNFLAYGGEYAPYIAALGLALWMWWRGEAPLRLPVATGFILAAGGGLLSQNAQTHGLPVAVVIAFLFYGELRQRRLQRLGGGSIALLLALLMFPLLSVATSAASLAGYHSKAGRPTLQTVKRSNLRGLAVPFEAGGLLDAFSNGHGDYRLLNRARAIPVRYELSPSEYVDTLQEAAALLEKAPALCSVIVLLDQVNPLPFMLGLPPARGNNLWSGPGAPVQPADKVFADADCVLIPKFSTYSPWTDTASARYGPYLDRHYPVRSESRSWLLLRRGPSRPATDDGGPLEVDQPSSLRTPVVPP
jgi:hypothetical protein